MTLIRLLVSMPASAPTTGVKPAGGTINQDAYEAVWEHLNGREMKYPENRYEKPVFMRPSASQWRPDAVAPGASRKNLGIFSECETAISVRKIPAGSQVDVPANTILFVMEGEGASGSVTSGSGAWEKHSSMFSGTEPALIRASVESEIVQIELPHL